MKKRFRAVRQSTGKRLELSASRLDILKLLNRYRYLRSTFIYALLPYHEQTIKVALRDMHHEDNNPHGKPYLDRPQQRWNIGNFRYQPEIYELSDAGRAALHDNGIRPTYRKTVQNFLHELMICDLLASIELGIRQNPSLRFVSFDDILDKAPEATLAAPAPLTLQLQGRKLTPDALFGIHDKSTDTYVFHALEADRATEPLTRAQLKDSSFARKIDAYQEATDRRLYKSWWGVPNLMVLTVTATERHMHGMIELVDKMTSGKGSAQFAFKHLAEYGEPWKAPRPAPEIITTPWLRSHAAPYHLKQ